jgi:hypothetical protein
MICKQAMLVLSVLVLPGFADELSKRDWLVPPQLTKSSSLPVQNRD